MNNQILPYKSNTKFLGLIFDSKLTWDTHISQLKGQTSKMLNLQKITTCRKWGADQWCSLKIYRTYIRSRLDYGSIVYGSAYDTVLQPLETICNEALRIATGAFKSTPIKSLHALCDENSLRERREMLCLRYYYKIKSFPSNPAFSVVTDTANKSSYQIRNLQKPPGTSSEFLQAP